MNYYKSTFRLIPILPAREVLVAELAERGYESFVETDDGLEAFIQEPDFSESLTDGLTAASMTDEFSAEHELIPDENWNAEWEKNFDPTAIDNKILIRAPFHDEKPGFEYTIIIEPKMSFGTGHHGTTYLMLEEMYDMDLYGKRILDMGSGTGVLAIFACMKKAAEVDAIDIDEWAFDNIAYNIALNHVSLNAFRGGAELLAERPAYDVILANINRNILTRDMGEYNEVLHQGGEILFSGFYESDFREIDEAASEFGWKLANKRTRNEWCMLRYRKQ